MKLHAKAFKVKKEHEESVKTSETNKQKTHHPVFDKWDILIQE